MIIWLGIFVKIQITTGLGHKAADIYHRQAGGVISNSWF